MKIADKIKFSLMRFTRSTATDVIVPNFYINSPWEMDLCRITKAGIVYEYEIKISRSDFKNDFKKANKHSVIKNGGRICNFFYFVVPEGLITKDEIPEYCGLYYYTKHDSFTLVKSPKRLHKNKFNDYKMLAEKLSFRCNVIQSKYTYERYLNKDLNKDKWIS
jgi:hypothetical protein